MKRALTVALLSGFVVMLYELLVVRLASPDRQLIHCLVGNNEPSYSLGLFVGNLLGRMAR